MERQRLNGARHGRAAQALSERDRHRCPWRWPDTGHPAARRRALGPARQVLELAETPAEGVTREVLEETGIKVQADRLTGVYKNVRLGVVTLAFRCSIIDGQGEQDSTDEARRVAWLTAEEATRQMQEARAIRVVDGVASSDSPAVRVRHGTRLL